MFINVNSVKLPVSQGLIRSLRSQKSHLDGSMLDEYDLKEYDYDTIFYDVFFDINNRFLYTVGPPFLNLGKSLFPITCTINNNSKRYLLQIIEYYDRKLSIGRLPLKDVALQNENTIEIDFNGYFQWEGMVGLNRHATAPIILTTIQKDNKVRWINEWIKFYSRNYHVALTIIYDNSSSNRDDLRGISGGDLLVVAWDFKYGPIRSHDNQFCQIGSLNHCRLKFGSDNVILNFDIDELLYVKRPGFKRYFGKYSLMLFNGYRVPFIKPVKEDYSYADFSFRDKAPQDGGRKYLYKADRIIVNNVHNAIIKRHASGLYRRLENKYYRLSLIDGKGLFLNLLLKFMSFILNLKIAPINEAYFLHYTGITNNWKSRYWNRTEEMTPSDSHVKFNISEL